MIKKMLLLAFAAAVSGAAIAEVCVFKDSYYRNQSYCFDRWDGGHHRLDQIGMNDNISSISMDRGEEVVVCTDSYMRGSCETFSSNVPAMPAYLNDRISSIEIRDRRDGGRNPNNEICFFEDSYQRGDVFCMSRRNANIQALDRYWNDRISSAIIPRGVKVIVYQDSYFRGRSLVLTPGVYDSLPGFNDATSSIEILPHR